MSPPFEPAKLGGCFGGRERRAVCSLGGQPDVDLTSLPGRVFRDPSEDDRVWVVFDWDEDGWQSFVSDPEVPPIMQ